MAVLRASSTDVGGTGSGTPFDVRLRTLALFGAVVSVVLIFVPPLWTGSSHYEYEGAIQFCLAAFGIPAFLVVGWPFAVARRWHIGRAVWRWCEQQAERRGRHRTIGRPLFSVGLDVALIVFWRTPGVVDALGRDRWLVAVELVSLAVAGVALWLEIVSCPPFAPRLALPRRGVLAALVMWGTWITAYAEGFAQSSWYRSFHGSSLSGLSGQEIATAVVFIAAFCAFMPVIYAEVVAWLNRDDDDPDDELRKIVREARRRGQA